MRRCIILLLSIGLVATSPAQAKSDTAKAAVGNGIANRVDLVESKLIVWRRDFHANPELGNREARTAAIVARHLNALGIETRTGIAHHGVVGVLRGSRPGPVIALRADMDALPVEEKTGLPFASKARGVYNGRDVPVAHACGHDGHTAMLMAAAEVLAGMRSELAGTIVFLFQPAEEGAPDGEEGGAQLMVKQGAIKDPKPQAVFGIHLMPGQSGEIRFRPKGFLAAADRIKIKLIGKQTHGSQPWAGIDITSLGADVIQSMNQIAARQVDLQGAPHVITIATINAGVRHNIIPETLEMSGTLRTFDPGTRALIMTKVKTTVDHLAAAYGAKAEVAFDGPFPLTWNDPALSQRLTPALSRASSGRINGNADVFTGSEDFGYFAADIPGLYIALGSTRPGIDPKTAPTNHSPYFDIDESALKIGVRAYVEVATAYLSGK